MYVNKNTCAASYDSYYSGYVQKHVAFNDAFVMKCSKGEAKYCFVRESLGKYWASRRQCIRKPYDCLPEREKLGGQSLPHMHRSNNWYGRSFFGKSFSLDVNCGDSV